MGQVLSTLREVRKAQLQIIIFLHMFVTYIALKELIFEDFNAGSFFRELVK